MANKAKKYCGAYPCNQLVQPGQRFCSGHEPTRPNREQDLFYGSARWQRFREWYRSKYPLCELCLEQGLTVPMDCVDHIIELKDGGAKLSAENAQSLCNACHGVKSAGARRNRGPVVYAY